LCHWGWIVTEGILCGYCNAQSIFVAINELVGCSSKSWVGDSQRQRGDHGDPKSKFLDKTILREIKHLRTKDQSTVINREYDKTISGGLQPAPSISTSLSPTTRCAGSPTAATSSTGAAFLVVPPDTNPTLLNITSLRLHHSQIHLHHDSSQPVAADNSISAIKNQRGKVCILSISGVGMRGILSGC